MSLVMERLGKGLEAAADDDSQREQAFLPYLTKALSRCIDHMYPSNDRSESLRLVHLGRRYAQFFDTEGITYGYQPRRERGQEPQTRRRAPSVTNPFNLFGMEILYFGSCFTNEEDKLKYFRALCKQVLSRQSKVFVP